MEKNRQDLDMFSAKASSFLRRNDVRHLKKHGHLIWKPRQQKLIRFLIKVFPPTRCLLLFSCADAQQRRLFYFLLIIHDFTWTLVRFLRLRHQDAWKKSVAYKWTGRNKQPSAGVSAEVRSLLLPSAGDLTFSLREGSLSSSHWFMARCIRWRDYLGPLLSVTVVP